MEVLDKPSAPEGPMKASDIHKEGCTLAWKAPEDDGGSEIVKYVVEKMDTSRGTWVNIVRFQNSFDMLYWPSVEIILCPG